MLSHTVYTHRVSPQYKFVHDFGNGCQIVSYTANIGFLSSVNSCISEMNYYELMLSYIP